MVKDTKITDAYVGQCFTWRETFFSISVVLFTSSV